MSYVICRKSFGTDGMYLSEGNSNQIAWDYEGSAVKFSLLSQAERTLVSIRARFNLKDTKRIKYFVTSL